MFEKWAEISKGKPDWLEVPVDAELLEKASARLKELGTTMEKAVVLLLTRMIEHGDEMLKMKEAGRPPEEIIAGLCSSVVWELVQNARERKEGSKMNLKEAFRFQNKLQTLTTEALCVLGDQSNVVTVESTFMRKKVMAEAEDETVLVKTDSEFGGRITELLSFVMYLQGEREKLSKAIRQAKAALSIDMDSEVSLNAKRQELVKTLRRMDDIRSSEMVVANGGTGYRFNAEGNQVSYRCDVKKVTTIDFDRKVVRRYIKELEQKIDSVSAEIDRCLVNSAVEYTVPFDVNDALFAVFEPFAAKETA